MWEHLCDSQQMFMCCDTKQEPLHRTPAHRLHEYVFWQPTPNFCRALIIDIDGDFALYYLNDLPKILRPQVVVLTPRGLHAYWFIEGIPLTENARQKPIKFAHDVGQLLKQAVNGDQAVNPVQPVKCRNPFYKKADLQTWSDNPPYKLRDLAANLRAYLEHNNVQVQQPKDDVMISSAVWGEMVEGQRNATLFNVVRKVAYKGGDFETAAYALNTKADEPLPDAEVAGIVRSVDKFMRTRYNARKRTEPMTEAEIELQRERGRKGGLQKTEKQQQALAKGTNAASVARSAKASGRKGEVQYWKEQGLSQSKVAAQMGIGIATVKRHWN